MKKEAIRLEKIFPKKFLKSKAGRKLLKKFFKGLEKLPASSYSKKIFKEHAEVLPILGALGPTPFPSTITGVFGMPGYVGAKSVAKQLAKGKGLKSFKAIPNEYKLFSKALQKHPFGTEHWHIPAMLASGTGLTYLATKELERLKKKKKKKKDTKKTSSLNPAEVIKLAAAFVVKSQFK